MRVPNETGIRNLCAVAVHLCGTMPVNAATKYAIRTVLREAINKSNANYKGNINRRNCRYISLAAQERLTGDSSTTLVVADHAKPVAECLREIEMLSPLTVDGVVTVIRGYAIMVLITQEEDARLVAAGLVKRMPPNWDGLDMLARYKCVGIDVKPNPAFLPDAPDFVDEREPPDDEASRTANREP